MPLVATLLFTAALAVLLPKFRASIVRGVQSQTTYRNIGISFETTVSAVKSALRMLIVVLLAAISVIWPRILSAIRAARTRQSDPDNNVREHETSVEDAVDWLIWTLSQLMRGSMILLDLTGVTFFAKAVWRSVNDEVKSWEASERASAGPTPHATQNTRANLTDLIAHLRSTLAPNAPDTLSSAGIETIATDMYVDPETGFITAMLDLPGVSKKNVAITLHGPTLQVSAQREVPKLDTLVQPILQERRMSGFVRVFRDIPFGLKSEDIKASMNMGVLTLTYPSEPLQPLLEGQRPLYFLSHVSQFHHTLTRGI